MTTRWFDSCSSRMVRRVSVLSGDEMTRKPAKRRPTSASARGMTAARARNADSPRSAEDPAAAGSEMGFHASASTRAPVPASARSVGSKRGSRACWSAARHRRMTSGAPFVRMRKRAASPPAPLPPSRSLTSPTSATAADMRLRSDEKAQRRTTRTPLRGGGGSSGGVAAGALEEEETAAAAAASAGSSKRRGAAWTKVGAAAGGAVRGSGRPQPAARSAAFSMGSPRMSTVVTVTGGTVGRTPGLAPGAGGAGACARTAMRLWQPASTSLASNGSSGASAARSKRLAAASAGGAGAGAGASTAALTNLLRRPASAGAAAAFAAAAAAAAASPRSAAGTTTPATWNSSDVSVPVLSKTQTSTMPPKTTRKGSVQKMPRRASVASEALMARASSIGSSGGTTDVMIIMQCSTSLYLLWRGCAQPSRSTYVAEMMAKTSKPAIKAKASQLPADTFCDACAMVRMRSPWLVW